MNLIQSIQEMIRKAASGKGGSESGIAIAKDSPAAAQDPQRFQEIMEGMGSGTARIVIDKEATRRIAREYAVKGPANKGRYYVARVVRPDGSIIDQLLVDKQTGSVQFLSRRA